MLRSERNFSTKSHSILSEVSKMVHCQLYKFDKDALTGNGWLNDQHMCVAQTFIKLQYPHIHGFTLTTKCKQFILHSIGTGMQTCGSQPLTHKPESLQSTQQTVPSVKTIIDDTPKHQNIPKWFTVNYINLIRMPLQAMDG